jgi:hypothetical protein
MTADQGAASVDVWMASDGTSVPTSSQSITGGAMPALTTGTRVRSTILTGWTTQVTPHSVFAFQLAAVSGGATTVNFSMECDQ